MSTLSVRIDENLISAARVAAKAEFRTVQGQVEYWAKVGRAAVSYTHLDVYKRQLNAWLMRRVRRDK